MINKQKSSSAKMDFNLLLAVIPSLSRTQNKIKSVLMIFFLLSSLYSLIYIQNWNTAPYVNATTSISSGTTSSLGESIQESQQDLQRTIENQVQQTFTDTINSMNQGQGNTTTTVDPESIQNNTIIAKILAKSLENYIQNAGAVLNITSQLPQVREVPLMEVLNQTLTTLHGIPQDADIQKRLIAQYILSSYKDFQIVIFVMPNGDIYLEEPYSRQVMSTVTNLGFRDYFKGVTDTNEIYIGNPSQSVSSGQLQSVIAVPVLSLEDNSTMVGIWAGGLDFETLNEELQSINLTSSDGYTRVVYVGQNGQKIADSDAKKSMMPESFANLTGFKNAINGQSGLTFDTIDNKNMSVSYEPVKVFQNTFVVLLMKSVDETGKSN
ncbi:MAG TPA: cache domain-containing protein [Candidatus Nitrosocosmicus sp.]|nr:cache domain-containing protein [Candidatus Nitrosocosmicus sp.]